MLQAALAIFNGIDSVAWGCSWWPQLVHEVQRLPSENMRCESLSSMPKQERKRTQDVDLVKKMIVKVKTKELQSNLEKWLSKQPASAKKQARSLPLDDSSSSDSFAS